MRATEVVIGGEDYNPLVALRPYLDDICGACLGFENASLFFDMESEAFLWAFNAHIEENPQHIPVPIGLVLFFEGGGSWFIDEDTAEKIVASGILSRLGIYIAPAQTLDIDPSTPLLGQ